MIEEKRIENEYVTAVISQQAAEVISFKRKDNDIEMIWCRDPEYWFNCNPILFPYTGRLPEDKYEFEGKTYDFSDETINILYRAKGLPARAQGLIELVSAWSEYNGEYYATGVTIGGPNNGFVVKTADFCTMTLVDAVPFNDMGDAEIASCVFADRLYVACRQAYGHPYLYLSYAAN